MSGPPWGLGLALGRLRVAGAALSSGRYSVQPRRDLHGVESQPAAPATAWQSLSDPVAPPAPREPEPLDDVFEREQARGRGPLDREPQNVAGRRPHKRLPLRLRRAGSNRTARATARPRARS